MAKIKVATKGGKTVTGYVPERDVPKVAGVKPPEDPDETAHGVAHSTGAVKDTKVRRLIADLADAVRRL